MDPNGKRRFWYGYFAAVGLGSIWPVLALFCAGPVAQVAGWIAKSFSIVATGVAGKNAIAITSCRNCICAMRANAADQFMLGF